MDSWVPGALLLGAGAVWIIARVTIEKKATSGSWLGHLIREIAVIKQIPIIGLIWRLLPLLLVGAGILWLSGVRPPGGDSGDSGDKPAVETGTLCADPSSAPDAVGDEWPSYQCLGEDAAGERWPRCLSRSAYTDQRRRGCPGAERCCPPR